MNNRGQIHNYFVIIALLFTLGILTMIAMVLMVGLEGAFSDAGMWSGIIETTGEGFKSSIQIYDTIIVLIMAVLMIGIGLTSYQLNTAPAFFIVTIIYAAFLGFSSYIFNYIFSRMVLTPELTAVQIYFPKLLAVCTNLHWIALATIIVGSLALYAKSPTPGGQFVE